MKATAIGRVLQRVEGRSKVTGSCVYSADVMRPDALWAGFLRSPYAHARILKIDVSRAQRLAGVKAVITGKDVSPRLEGVSLLDKSVLAQDRVRFIGEKVAAVAATDKQIAAEALDLIDVEYEELPAVFDPQEAMKPDAPLLHPDFASYQGPNKTDGSTNARSRVQTTKGDVEQGFRESDEIFESAYATHAVHQGFIEPRAGLVEVDLQGRVAIWQSHQSPFGIRRWLAEHADIPEEMIVVHPVSTGGSFGGKQGAEDAIVTYYLARAAKRAVKFVESYQEELQDGQPRHASVIKLRTGVKKDGTLWAWDAEVYYNGGAYGARTPQNRMNGTFMAAGTYRTPHVRMTGYIVYTNQVPSGYFRAPGEVQTLFAVESHVDEMARALDLDPLEFRLRNALREGDTKPNGEHIRDLHAVAVLKRVAGLARWRKGKRKTIKNGGGLARGRGIAFADRHIGIGESEADIAVEADGSLRLTTAVRDVGVGAYTMHRQVAAEVLGVAPELVEIDVAGTDGPYDEGVRAQRGTHVEGLAVFNAATSLIDGLRREAARIWNVEPKNVQWRRGRAHLKGAKKSLDLKTIARAATERSLRARGYSKPARPETFTYQGVVADVAVDKVTGEIKVEKIYYVIDATKIINPLIYYGHIHGGVIQGLGFSLTEHLEIEGGRVTALSLGDYKLPTIRDIPQLSTAIVKANEGPGPFGAKAVGEAGISLVAPAIANAIADATGIRIKQTPLTAEKIFHARQQRS
ncbi:MAG: xanthine dehydrogenase family protein molybdopterin-binding subunit [Candidatus Binatia bacterium]